MSVSAQSRAERKYKKICVYRRVFIRRFIRRYVGSRGVLCTFGFINKKSEIEIGSYTVQTW